MWVNWPNTHKMTTTKTIRISRAKSTATPMSGTRRSGRPFNATMSALLIIALAAPHINGFRTIELNSGEGRKLFGGYRITPKHCRATRTLPLHDPRFSGATICMFNHECAQRNGEVVGACMDGFLFGACCQLPHSQSDELESTLIKDAQNNYYQQQMKLQAQQAVSNPAAAQSYETYGESSLQQQQQEQEETGIYPTTQQQGIFEQGNLDKVYQQLEMESGTSNYAHSSQPTANYPNVGPPSNSNPVEASPPSYSSASSASSSTNNAEEQHAQQNILQDVSDSAQEEDVSGSTESGQNSSQELDNDTHVLVNAGTANPNALAKKRPPPEINVHKNSVKISSPSSPPHNDDFVMQVLSTLPPENESDHIIFTTEVPMKIASSLVEQTSSESNSFEEEPVTQLPLSLKKPEIQLKQSSSQQQPNKHHHNHLVLSDTEFTHSDITHPGADADLLEDDLQFSTGYGPQPVYVESPQLVSSPPKQVSAAESAYDTPDTGLPANEENYVLVQTITNEQGYKKPIAPSVSTTSATITTHDSIESIILQLNGTNQGPAYQLITQQQDAQTNGYYEASTPAPISVTYSNTQKYYEGTETERTEKPAYLQAELQGDAMQQYGGGGPSGVSQIPAYLEPVTTNLQLNAESSYNTVAEDKNDMTHSYMQNAYPSPRPDIVTESSPATSYGDDAVLDEHTMPENSYEDSLGASGHLTSEFNKMPAVGIAYPVDMSHIEEEENSGYAGSPTSQRPVILTKNDYQKTTELPEPNYTRRPATSTTEPRPIASYIGVVTSQNYNAQQPPVQTYNQLPAEVSVSSYVTKVQADAQELPSSSAYDTTKLTTASYADSSSDGTAETLTSARPSNGYISSTTIPIGSRPQYSNVGTSTLRPVLITASSTKPKLKPKPSIKRPNKRPSSTTTSGTSSTSSSASLTKKTSKPQRKPTVQPIDTYKLESDEADTNDYNHQKHPATQPVKNYNNNSAQTKPMRQTAAPLGSSYTVTPNYSSGASKKPTAASSTTYNQGGNTTGNVHSQRPIQITHKTKQPPSYQLEYTSARPTASAAYAQKQQQQQKQQEIKLPASQPSFSYNDAQHVNSAPPFKRTSTRKPATNNYNYNKKTPTSKPISTSYVTGPTTPRPPTTFVYHDNEVPPLLVADDKLDAFVHSTATAIPSATPSVATYQAPLYVSSVAPLTVERPHSPYKKPGFVKITERPPMPTVLITPKPTVINLVTSSSWTQQPSGGKTPPYSPTTPIPVYGSTSYVYSPLVTRRPGSTPSYVSVSPVTSNDFDDPGYFGIHSSSNPQHSSGIATYSVPTDERPAFPGYYGPTPTYATYAVPGEMFGSPIEEETYTSPNDFVNFPPVRNPNLNMSAASSAVTTDLELSTPAFVEDGVLKDKMNTLVHKIVESLQDNFEALAELIDETNVTAAAPTLNYQPGHGGTTVTKKPTRKPTRVTPATSTKQKPVTTKRPPTRVSTRKPISSSVTTRKPVTQRRPSSTTNRPTTRRPASKRPSTTIAVNEDLVDEEDGDDVNNEIDQSDNSPVAGGRKLQCGVRPQVKSGRIVGGKGSTFGAFPWQVLVRESTWLGLFTKNKCGGVLITNRYVITAAHCQPGFLASLVAVMGEYDISGELEDKRAVTKNVKRVIVHRQYDPATFENDLALLEMESPVQYDTHIVPICMPLDTADFTGRMATVTGWGRLKYGGGVPSVLQEVQVPIIENSVCQEMFHTAGHNKKILGSFLCAGYANGQKDSCEGDSGGPLVLQRPDGRYELAGTVSHGIKCAAPYLPGVYMRTTFYKPWLRSITGVK